MSEDLISVRGSLVTHTHTLDVDGCNLVTGNMLAPLSNPRAVQWLPFRLPIASVVLCGVWLKSVFHSEVCLACLLNFKQHMHGQQENMFIVDELD